MSSTSSLRLLASLLYIGSAMAAWACSDAGPSAPCDWSAESGIHYAVEWQDHTGSCVSSSVMFENQCTPGGRFAIRLGLTDDDKLAPYNQPDAQNLWYVRTDTTVEELPQDAIDTGLSHTGRSLHIASDRETAYVDTRQAVESWRRVNTSSC